MAMYNQVKYGSVDEVKNKQNQNPNSGNLGYGSSGDEVKKLQEILNQNGYNLDVDGIFGTNTQSAVKDYQQKNNLAVDGIVGVNTWGALNKAQTSTPTTSTPTQEAPPAQETTPEKGSNSGGSTSQYDSYQPSDTVKQAEAMLRQLLAQKPGEYQSQWQGQLDEILANIMNREKFSYDLNADALYQQYRNQYVMQGQQAMMDTMGQAAALTGGYGNSYAQTAGQQAYHGYLQQLNDVMPELYRLALSKYQMEGDEMAKQYAMLGAREDQDYGRYQDDLAAYYAELDRLTEDARYQSEADYEKYLQDLSFAYQQDRDKVADDQWQAEYDEAKRQYDQAWEQKYGSSAGGSTEGSGGGGGGGGYDNHGYDSEMVKKAQSFVGASADGYWGSNSAAAAKKKGYNSLADVIKAMNGGGDTSYYEQLLGAVSTAKGAYSKQDYQTRQKAYQETVAAINDAYNSGKITAEEKAQLMRIATPGGR